MATIVTRKLLAQKMPSQTLPTVLYTNPSGARTEIKQIIVANVTAGALTYSIYYDSEGSIFTDQKALFRNSTVPANQSIRIDFNLNGLHMAKTGETIAVQASAANGITFSIWGEDIRES